MNLKYVSFDSRCIKSIKEAEKKKFNLECKGYNLINTNIAIGFSNIVMLTYRGE